MRSRWLIAFACAVAMSVAPLSGAFAAQGSGCLPTTGTISGLVFAQDTNAAIAALISSNSGASAPATDCTAVAIKGQVWLDTSATPNILKQYDGASWLVIGFIDSTNHIWTPPMGGGTAAIVSATTTDLWSLPQSSITVSGTATITALASASAVPGTMKIVKFSGVMTLTYNATSLVLPSAVDITTAAGDYALVVSLTSSNVAVVSYNKGDGTAVVNPSVPIGTKLDFLGTVVPPKFVRGVGQQLARASYPDYVTATTITQSASRVFGSAVLTGFADTLMMGPGQPLEGTGIPSGATIGSTTSTTVTMASTCGGGASACTASSSGTSNVVVIVHGYGAGGNSSSIGVPNCSGRITLARDTLGGVVAGVVTLAGSNIHAEQLGAFGGREKGPILVGELPASAPTFTGSLLTVVSNVGDILRNPSGVQVTPSGAGSGIGSGVSGVGGYTISSTGTPAGTISNLGSGNDRPHMPPVLVADCIVRVLP